MSYNKDKALQTLDVIIQSEQNENARLAGDDLRYALNLALIAYSSHLAIWSDIPEHSNQDTKEYCVALHNIHKTLVEARIFDDTE